MSGRSIRYTLRRSSRAKWVSGWIRPETGLVVTVPASATARQAEAFVIKHQRWVVRQLERWATLFAKLPRPWPYGTSLLYRGESHTVEIRQAGAGSVERTPQRRLIICAPSGGIEGARWVLRRWLMREATPVLAERAETLGAQMGLRAKRIYVRNLRWRWGSCWPGDSLSFNYRLIMAPPHILDYVVVHELAHLKERNHSPLFWSLVAGQCPSHRDARIWLRTFGVCLGV